MPPKTTTPTPSDPCRAAAVARLEALAQRSADLAAVLRGTAPVPPHLVARLLITADGQGVALDRLAGRLLPQ